MVFYVYSTPCDEPVTKVEACLPVKIAEWLF